MARDTSSPLTLLHDSGRSTRYRITTPPYAISGKAPIVLFSHGAGSKADLYGPIYHSLSMAGFVVVAPDHAAGNSPVESWRWRCEDMLLPLDQLEGLGKHAGVGLDPSKVILAGHSYGAVTAMALAGATMGEAFVPAQTLENPLGLIALSPPGAREGMLPENAWDSVRVDSFLQYGDADVIAGFVDDARLRGVGYVGRADHNRWLAVSEKADHTFGGLICDLRHGPLAEDQHASLVRLCSQIANFSASTMGRGIIAPSPDGRLVRLREAERPPSRALVRLLPAGSRHGRLRIWEGGDSKSTLVFLTGAGCEAVRYDWLSALTHEGCRILIADVAEVQGLSGLHEILDLAQAYGDPVVAAGHSAGAALVLDALVQDGHRNPRLDYGPEYAPPQNLKGVISLGCSLQPQMLDFVLPHRSEDAALDHPQSLKLLMVSGTHDAIATPARVAATANRYRSPAGHQVIAGGSHYGFASGFYDSDNRRADLDGSISKPEQQANTLEILKVWLTTVV